MQRVRVPLNSFQFGEISDTTIMRTDSPVYASSAQLLQNVLVQANGGAKKRPGMKHIYKYSGITYNNQPESHLFKFAFSDDEQYVISVEHQKVRCFYLNQATGAVTLVSTITQDVDANALPFDRDYLKEYTAAQYGDVLFICHPLFMPRMLVRTSLTSFEVTSYSFDARADGDVVYQPYSRFHATGVTLDPSATTGTGITLTTSEDYFTSDHVGVTLRYGETEIEITGYTSATQVTADVIGTLRVRLSILDPLRTENGSDKVEVTQIAHGFQGGESVTIEGAVAVGGINAAQINGARTVYEVIDENTYSITAGAVANASEDGGGYVKVVTHAPTDNWDEQSFSAVRGYPAAVTFHENRLVFGGTIREPDSLWFSRSGSFFNFDPGDANDADAINLVAATGDVNTIRYLISNRDLQIFTDNGELYVPAYLNQPITPTNVQVKKQTPYGCEFVYPQPFDGATLFVQAGGTVVREYLYTDSEDAYTSTAISSAASHLIQSPRCFTTIQAGFDGAESYAVLSIGNGDLSLFNSARAEKRAAWTRVTTDGNFCSVVGIQNRLFANVWDDDGYQHLVEFDGDVGLDRYLDLTASSGSVDVSAAYLAADTVYVIAYDSNGQYPLGEFTVSGTQTVDVSAYSEYTTFYVGKKFDAKIVSNPIDVSAGNGPVTGDVRGISAVVADFNNTYTAKVNNRPILKNGSFTGKHEFRINGYSRNPQVTIEQDEPMPFHVNGFITELVI